MLSVSDLRPDNALGLSVSGETVGPLISAQNGRLRDDSPFSPISSSPTLSSTKASRLEASARRMRNRSRFPDIILPDSIPFPKGPPRFDNSRNPTAFSPRDLRTTIADGIPKEQASAKPKGGPSRLWHRTLRDVAIATLKAKFPCLDTQGPVDPLLQSADEILRLDSLLGKVLTALPMEELIEMHSLHLQVKREIEPWFEECQIPKPWIGTPKPCATWIEREEEIYLASWPFPGIVFESRAKTPAERAYHATICQIFQGTVSWNSLRLIQEDRNRYRKMDYAEKKAWLRALFVVAAVQPLHMTLNRSSRVKPQAEHDRRIQPSLNAPCHPSSAGSSSATGDRPRATTLGKQSYSRSANHGTNKIDAQNGDGYSPHSGMRVDGQGKLPAQSGKHCFSGRTASDCAIGQDVGPAYKGKPWVWIVGGVARTGIGFVSAPASEHWREDDPDWTPSSDPWAITPTEASPSSHIPVTPASPSTSYHADGEDTGTDADDSFAKTSGPVADPPLDVVDDEKGTSVLPSGSSLTEILANRPPGYEPRVFFPKSQAQQYLSQPTSLQHGQHIDRSSRAPHIRPPPRQEPYQERLRAHLTSHLVHGRPTLTTRQPPPAPRKSILSEHRHRSILVPACRPSGSVSSPAAGANAEPRLFLASYRHDTATAHKGGSSAISLDAEVEDRACLQSARPDDWIERSGRTQDWLATLPDDWQAPESSSAPPTSSLVNRQDGPIGSSEGRQAWLVAQREVQSSPEPPVEKEG